MNSHDVHALGRHIATFAGRAPSVHNTQPWHFSLDGHLLHVYANPARRLLVSDPDGREMLVSCGAAIRFAELIAQQYVEQIKVTYFPNQVRRLHLATIELGGTLIRPTTPFTGIEETIDLRWSDRRPFGAPNRPALAYELAMVDERHTRCSVTLAEPETVALITAMGAQHQHAENAPEQHPVLVGARNGEGAEDQRDDEDVVEGEALLDDEAGQVEHAGVGAEVIPDPAAEEQGDADIERGEDEAAADADLVIAAVEHAEIEDEKRRHDADEQRPRDRGLAEKLGTEK